jgi:ATP-dependent Clp protease ATP-binding subunit ClpA
MFERFTDQSRRAVVLAQEEARRLNHNYIGTEHLLVGLQHEGRGAAAKALKAMDITLDAVRAEIETLVGRGQQLPSGHIPFTPPAKKCLELSLRQALQLGDNYIGTGHLLLGLISKDDCVAVQILGRLGADLDQLRAWVTREIRARPEVHAAPQLYQRVQVSSAVQGLLDTIDERLSAIERHLGIASNERQKTGGGGPEADESSETDKSSETAGELAQSRAEVARLRALLRDHDIDPDDPGDPRAAAG